MTNCQCMKKDGKKCTRDASTKPNTNHIYCWQHQNCIAVGVTIEGKSKDEPMEIKPTYDVAFIKDKVSDILRIIIDSLTQNVYFDYETREIFLLNGQASEEIVDQDMIKENFAREQIDKINNYLATFSNYANWFDTPFLPGITSLSIDSDSGFNEDERSHRGDIMMHSDMVGKRMQSTMCFNK